MNCKNCDTQLSEVVKYCQRCGAKVIRNRLTFRNLWDDFQQNFLNIENTVLKTYLDMFRKPEVVIGGFVNGTRKRYFNVISYFALAVTISGIQLFILTKFFPDKMDISPLVLDSTPKEFTNMDWMYEYYSLIVLINLPIYSFIAYLVFYSLKRYNFTEHFVTMTYISAQFAITSAVITVITSMLGLNFYIVGSVMNLFLMIFTAYCYKRLFGLSLGGILIRSLLFIGIAIVLLICLSILQVAYYLYTGEFQKLIDAEKERRGLSYIVSSAKNWTS